jgi:hypothetical protein
MEKALASDLERVMARLDVEKAGIVASDIERLQSMKSKIEGGRASQEIDNDSSDETQK